jgi:DNA-binding NtrC family response regulator
MKQDNALHPSTEVLSQLFKIEERFKKFSTTADNSSFGENNWETLLNVVFDRFCSTDSLSLKEFMDDLERKLIIRMLFIANGNRRDAAKLLGIKYTTLHEKLKKHNIHFRNMAY